MVQPVETQARTQPGPLPEQWPAQATEAIVSVVGTVRDRTTEPAITASRAVVYGLFAAILGIVAAVLAITLVIRLANNYIPGGIWIVYLGLGAIFALGGLVLWSKAFATSSDDR
jgi:hypothetical protein